MKNDMFQRKIAFRAMAVALTFMLMFGGVFVSFSESDYKNEINETKNGIAETRTKLTELEKMIADRQDALTNIARSIAALEQDKLEQMSDKEALVEELTQLKEDIERFDAEIEEMEKKHDELVDTLLDRARILYQSSADFDVIQMLFNSNGLFDFLRRREIHQKMIEDDKDLIANVLESERQLEEKRRQQLELFANKEQLLAELEQVIEAIKNDTDFAAQNYETLAAMLSTLEEQEADYSEEVVNMTQHLNNLERLQREYEEEQRRKEEEARKAAEAARKAAEEAERQRLLEEARKAAEAARKAAEDAERARKEKEEAERAAEEALKPKNNPLDWDFCWPIEKYTCISSQFGYRIHPITKTNQLHSGVDLAASTGTKIYAAQSGTVHLAREHGAFGLAVIINHGQGLQTLYGHCSKLLVTEGQKVTRGQVIALVGMTGGATGPHLHFEVRENGTPVEPLPYLAGLY